MTSKDKILEYLRRKNEWIKEVTGLVYCYDSDFEDVKKWEDEMCDKIWAEMLAYAKEEKKALTVGELSAKLCPWCNFKHFTLIDCIRCSWGRAHGGGNCMTYDFKNSWPKIRMALKNRGHIDYNDFPINLIKKIEEASGAQELLQAYILWLHEDEK